MSRVPMTQAVAADYADAMLVARRAKNMLFLCLALFLLIQMAIFFVVKYVPSVKIRADVTTSTSDTSTTSLTVLEHKTTDSGNSRQVLSPIFEYVTAFIDFCGILLAIVLPVILLLIITIMLVGRLVGVSHVTSAFCWSIVFLVLLFPWQSLLNSDVHHMPAGATVLSTPLSTTSADLPDVRIPGALYTFPELRRDYNFPNEPLQPAVLHWFRFAGLPLIELILLLVVNTRSSRGLRFALGESELPVEILPTSTV